MATNPLFSRAVGGAGGGAFGGIPAQIPVPPNIFAQASGIVPNLEALAAQAGGVAGNELAGRLSPETMRSLQDEGAAWGVQAGMPGFTPGSLVQNRSLRSLGLTTEAMQRQGIQDFLSTLTGIGNTLTPQPLAAEISNRNALMAAAPDPAAAANEQLRQWMEKFRLTQGSGGRGLNWAQMYGSAPSMGGVGFGAGTPNFLGGAGGFQAGAGGAPEVGPFGALGPFPPDRAPTPFTLPTGNTRGGSAGSPAAGTGFYAGNNAPYDDILASLFNPEDYYGPETDQARTSGGELGAI
jgi:hypothetical protein